MSKLHPHTTPRKPADVLYEQPRTAGGLLRVVREELAGRAIVRLLHLAKSGATVHAFALDAGELLAVSEALVLGDLLDESGSVPL